MSDREGRVAGLVFRGYADALEKFGLKDRVRRRLSPATAELLQSPPNMLTWFPYATLAELLTAMGSETDRNTVVKVARESALTTLGPVVLPVAKMIVTLSGASPAALFKRLSTITTIQFKGGKFLWSDESATSGTLQLEMPVELDDFNWAGWEGVLSFGFEVTKVTGRIHPSVRTGPMAARMRIEWTS